MQRMTGKYREMEGKRCVVWDKSRDEARSGVFDRYVPGGRDNDRRGYRLRGQSPLGNAFKNIDFPDYPEFRHTKEDKVKKGRL